MTKNLKPETKENVSNYIPEFTFENTDKLNQKDFAVKLTRSLVRTYSYDDGATVLSLNADYGYGKTTFLKMWESMLKEKEYNHKIIYINSWETDFDEEPIIPIVSGILDIIKKDTSLDYLETALEAVLDTTASIGNSVIKGVTGMDIIETLRDVQKKSSDKDLQTRGESIYNNYSYKLKAYKELKTALERYIESLDGKPLIIFVDELDRVRPNYAVKFLEAIKHLFSIRGICFVIAVNRTQLEKSVKQLYGNIDFDRYYQRFITRETSMPSFEKINWEAFTLQHISPYFSDNFPIKLAISPGQKNTLLRFACTYIRFFRLMPREAVRVIKSLFQILLLSDNKHGSHIYDETLEVTLFLVMLMVSNQDIFHKIGRNEISAEDFKIYLDSLDGNAFNNIPHKNANYDFYFSWFVNSSNKNSVGKIVYMYQSPKITSSEITDDQILEGIRHLRASYNNDLSLFNNYYKKIQEWVEFI